MLAIYTLCIVAFSPSFISFFSLALFMDCGVITENGEMDTRPELIKAQESCIGFLRKNIWCSINNFKTHLKKRSEISIIRIINLKSMVNLIIRASQTYYLAQKMSSLKSPPFICISLPNQLVSTFSNFYMWRMSLISQWSIWLKMCVLIFNIWSCMLVSYSSQSH